MIQRKEKRRLILFLIVCLMVLPLTIFYIIDGAGFFDTRGRANYSWESCDYSQADLDMDGRVTMSDYGEWLRLWRSYKACQEGLSRGDSSMCLAGCIPASTSIPIPTPTPTPTPLPVILPDSDFVSEDFQINQQQVAVYYPTDTAGEPDRSKAPFPVVVFHHGMAAKYDYYTWLAEALAKKGYIVVMPNRPMTEMDMDAGGNLTSDVLGYLDQRNSSSGDKLYQLVDKDKLIVSGHSLGAGLSLFASESLKTQVKGLVLLASGGKVSSSGDSMFIPGMDMFEQDMSSMEDAFERMRDIARTTNVPIMYMIGSEDKIIDPEGTKELYSLTNSKKLIAIINGGNHVQFVEAGGLETQIMLYLDGEATISGEEQRDITAKYFVAWIDYIIKGDQRARQVIEEGKNQVTSTFSLYDFSL